MPAVLPPFSPFRHRPDSETRIQSALIAIRCILAADDVLPEHKTELLSVCLWKITEAEGMGKYQTRFVSTGSINRPVRELAHEHVHERRKLVQKLLDRSVSVDELPDYAIACTVSRDEHRLLGSVSEKFDGWDRYREAGIAVIDRVGRCWWIPP
jgi:hypothetical protein